LSVPIGQQLSVGAYILSKKLLGETRYPLVLMLEPLFQCNLACAGCGKIDYPQSILRQRLSVQECFDAVDECGAPVVSIAGGEPLVHKDIRAIVEGIVARKKYVYLCTNAILLREKLDLFTPSQYLTLSVHLDGLKQKHDASVCREGVFDKAIDAVTAARSRGFRVTVNCTLFNTADPREVADFFDYVTDLGVDGITLSPGYSYQHAPRQDVFLGRKQSKSLFRSIFRRREKRWPLSHSSLFLSFLCGNEDYACTPWSNPTRNVFGWQKPCYLVGDGYAKSFSELMEMTAWESYGTGRNPKCDNCMAHCGYEGTAVEDAVKHPLKALLVSLSGPNVYGPMVPEPAVVYKRPADGGAAARPAALTVLNDRL
jgi:hopanoid biosynthesis associated radical SAM protein HpnH